MLPAFNQKLSVFFPTLDLEEEKKSVKSSTGVYLEIQQEKTSSPKIEISYSNSELIQKENTTHRKHSHEKHKDEHKISNQDMTIVKESRINPTRFTKSDGEISSNHHVHACEKKNLKSVYLDESPSEKNPLKSSPRDSTISTMEFKRSSPTRISTRDTISAKGLKKTSPRNLTSADNESTRISPRDSTSAKEFRKSSPRDETINDKFLKRSPRDLINIGKELIKSSPSDGVKNNMQSAEEQIDSNFIMHLEEFKENLTSIKCTVEVISFVADNIIRRQIDEDTKTFTFVQWDIERYANEITGIVQNALIPQSPIPKRVKFFQNRLAVFLTQYSETPLTKIYQSILHDLSLQKPKLKNLKGLHSVEINLSHFLTCIDKIQNHTYRPSDLCENLQIKKLIKRIAPYVFLLFGDVDDTQKEVLKLLRSYNSSLKMAAKLKENLVVLINESIARQNISCIENVWTEAVDNNPVHQRDNNIVQQRPIDETPLKDMVESYVRDGAITGTVWINGELLQVQSPCSDAVYLYKLLSTLYLAFGFEIPEGRSTDKDSLKGQIVALLDPDQRDTTYYSPETLRCFRLLKMGSIISWGKADIYLRLGLGDLLKGNLTLGPRILSDEILFNFHIDTDNYLDSYVEQVKIYNICINGDRTEIKAKFPVSWKVYLPDCKISFKEQMWNCCLRILKISIFDNAGQIIANRIEYHMVNFMQDTQVIEDLKQKSILIIRYTKKSLVAEAKGIEIIPAPEKLKVEILKYSQNSYNEVRK